MLWMALTFLLLVALTIAANIHPEAPTLVVVAVIFAPLFLGGLGMVFNPRNNAFMRFLGILVVMATGSALLWGISLMG